MRFCLNEGFVREMLLNCRIGHQRDFSDFYENCYYLHRRNPELRRLMEHEWKTFTSEPATLTHIIEDVRSPLKKRIVGCGQVVFVTDAFVRHAREEGVPWVNVQASNPLPDFSCPTLDSIQVRSANSKKGLNALITRWDCAEPPLSHEDGNRVRELLARVFDTYSRGYQYKEVFIQVVGQSALRKAMNTGFRLRCNYEEYYADNPPLPSPDKRPYLVGLNRGEIEEAEGSIAAHLFVYTPPRFHFSRGEQTLLAQSLEGTSDEDVAEISGCTLSGVKACWQRVYTRVQDADAGILPESSGQTRGAEKRRRLLRYLQIHPEELRPVNTAPARAKRAKL